MDRTFFKMCVSVAVAAIAIFAATSSASAAGTDQQGAAAPDTPPDFTETVLSDEREKSRWAFVKRRVIAYSKPKNKGRKVRRLTTRTPDRTNELVLVLRERKYTDGSKWSLVRLPMRGSGRTGWVKRSSLDRYRVVRTRLVINRKRYRATLYKKGKRIWTARIGIGKRGTITPTGNFYVRNRLITTNPRGVYGPYAMGFSAYSSTLSDWPGGGVVGIHGTNKPGILPGRVSHGCIRVKNSKIRTLFRRLPPGTPVKITR